MRPDVNIPTRRTPRTIEFATLAFTIKEKSNLIFINRRYSELTYEWRQSLFMLLKYFMFVHVAEVGLVPSQLENNMIYWPDNLSTK